MVSPVHTQPLQVVAVLLLLLCVPHADGVFFELLHAQPTCFYAETPREQTEIHIGWNIRRIKGTVFTMNIFVCTFSLFNTPHFSLLLPSARFSTPKYSLFTRGLFLKYFKSISHFYPIQIVHYTDYHLKRKNHHFFHLPLPPPSITPLQDPSGEPVHAQTIPESDDAKQMSYLTENGGGAYSVCFQISGDRQPARMALNVFSSTPNSERATKTTPKKLRAADAADNLGVEEQDLLPLQAVLESAYTLMHQAEDESRFFLTRQRGYQEEASNVASATLVWGIAQVAVLFGVSYVQGLLLKQFLFERKKV